MLASGQWHLARQLKQLGLLAGRMHPVEPGESRKPLDGNIAELVGFELVEAATIDSALTEQIFGADVVEVLPNLAH